MRKLLVLNIFLLAVYAVNAQEKFTDPRDGNTYTTINLAGKIWMAENLRHKVAGDGAAGFDNNPDNIQAYGNLYDWKTANKVCPDGWHLPSGEEFRAVLNNYEVEDFWKPKGSDRVSFNIQLAGMQDYEGTFTEMDESAYLWTSTEYDKNEAEFFIYMNTNGKPIIDISRRQDMPDIHGAEKTNKYSVRCVKN